MRISSLISVCVGAMRVSSSPRIFIFVGERSHWFSILYIENWNPLHRRKLIRLFFFFYFFTRKKYIVRNNRTMGSMKNQKNFFLYHRILLLHKHNLDIFQDSQIAICSSCNLQIGKMVSHNNISRDNLGWGKEICLHVERTELPFSQFHSHRRIFPYKLTSIILQPLLFYIFNKFSFALLDQDSITSLSWLNSSPPIWNLLVFTTHIPHQSNLHGI